MKTLLETLWSPRQRELFSADLIALIEQHISGRSGLRGTAIRSGFALARTAKPDLLPRAVARLGPEFIAAMQPLYEQFQKSPDRDFSVYLQKHADTASAALLAVADAHVATSPQAGLLRRTFRSLRGFAEEEVRLAVPAIGKLIRGYM